MQLTILPHYPSDRHLAIGEASIVRNISNEKSLIMACPKCGTDIALSGHRIVWLSPLTVTVEPSIVHKGETAQILHDSTNCQAHFFIKNNQILELA